MRRSKILIISFLSFIFILQSYFTSCDFVRKPSLEITACTPQETKEKPVVKVFLENSGSMDGYMCAGAELKDDVYNYLTCMRSCISRFDLNYINSKIINRGTSLSQYIRDLTPSSFRKAGGSRAYSKISSQLDSVLFALDENSVVIYISDCILDLPNHSASDFLNITRTDINSIFMDKKSEMPDLAVAVYQLESTFNGNFYYPRGGARHYVGKLPYYMIMIGRRHLLANIRESVSDDKIIHGIKNYCAFVSNFETSAIFSQKGRKLNKIDLKVGDKDGGYSFKVCANLSETLQSNQFLSNLDNYQILNSSKLTIMKVNEITNQSSLYSHLIDFRIIENAFSDKIQLKNPGLPLWVCQSNDDDGSQVFENKTFGIKYLLGGISDAFADRYISNFRINVTLK